jgi:exosortase D (VPLPA-CTERM-specific)
MTIQLIDRARKPGVPTALLMAVAVFATILVFWGALTELVHRWTTQEEYSHGFLIPVISAWLLWMRRDALVNAVGRPNWLGPVFILIAAMMNLVGELSASFILCQLGFMVAVVGFVLSIGGYELLRVALIPIIFLLFAIPLPYFVDAELTLRLQLVSSQLGVFFIRMFGIPVYLDGNIIDLGAYKLQVVEACSGLRYLYPLLSLSFLAAYVFNGPLWQRALLFLSGIPIAILTNGFRIGMVGVSVDHWGTAMAEGALHLFEGWVVFLASAALLILEMYVLSFLSRRSLRDIIQIPEFSEGRRTDIGARAVSNIPLLTCILVLSAGGAAAYSISGRTEIAQNRLPFAEFPVRIGSWQGDPSLLDVDTERALAVTDYILSDYRRTDGKAVNLYVAYYASQRKGESPHSPIVCIPGGGWRIVDIREMRSPDGDFPFNRVVIKKGNTTQVVYYWFDERGRRMASEYGAKLHLFADAILRNRTDGAMIRLTTKIEPTESEHDADRRLNAFMQDAVPRLSTFLPADNSAGTTTLLSTSARVAAQ